MSKGDRAIQGTLPVLHFLDNYRWPPHYNESRMTLMIRDPQCLYAYWNYNEDQYKAFVSRFFRKKSRWLIRLINVAASSGIPGNREHRCTDITIVPDAESIYIDLPGNTYSCSASMGIQTGGGVFHPFIQSNTVIVPFVVQSKPSVAVTAEDAQRVPDTCKVASPSYSSCSCLK